MLKNITLLSMILCLSACQSFERRAICKQISAHQIKPHQACDVSFKHNRCRCREFDFNNWKALGPSTDYDILHCEGISGFYLDDIANDIRPNVKALANIKGNLCL